MCVRSVFRLPPWFGDVAINCADQTILLAEARARLRRGAGFAIATLNLDHLVKLRKADRFRQAYERQDLVVADGHPVVWLSRLARRPVSLVPGSDLIGPLARLAAEEGVDVALVGATDATLAAAADRLRERTPGLRIVARIAPEHGFEPEGEAADAVIAALEAAGARLVLVALGAPKQEIFAARARAALPEVGFASIGAGLDFLAGSQQRAPRWMRRLALEWLWRVLTEPRRLARRYFDCLLILPKLTIAVLARRLTVAEN